MFTSHTRLFHSYGLEETVVNIIDRYSLLNYNYFEKAVLFLDMFVFLDQATSTVEVDPDAIEKLRVSRKDFMHAFEHDIKPVS